MSGIPIWGVIFFALSISFTWWAAKASVRRKEIGYIARHDDFISYKSESLFNDLSISIGKRTLGKLEYAKVGLFNTGNTELRFEDFARSDSLRISFNERQVVSAQVSSSDVSGVEITIDRSKKEKSYIFPKFEFLNPNSHVIVEALLESTGTKTGLAEVEGSLIGSAHGLVDYKNKMPNSKEKLTGLIIGSIFFILSLSICSFIFFETLIDIFVDLGWVNTDLIPLLDDSESDIPQIVLLTLMVLSLPFIAIGLIIYVRSLRNSLRLIPEAIKSAF